MNTKTPIGARIQRRRRQLGISQRDLSQIAGVSVHTLSDIESGKGNPTLATLERVLQPLGLVFSVGLRAVE